MITTTYTSEEWQAYAECAAPTINNDIFFSEEIHEIATAKSICLNCSVISKSCANNFPAEIFLIDCPKIGSPMDLSALEKASFD